MVGLILGQGTGYTESRFRDFPRSLHEIAFKVPSLRLLLHSSKSVSICRIWGFHSGGYEEYYLLEYNVVFQFIVYHPIIRRTTVQLIREP
jgi:hypothetical protein